MLLSKLQIDTGDTNYYSPGFRQVIEDHLSWLQKSSSTNQITLSPQAEYKYIGDFYSLLQNIDVNQDMYWITMRLNGLHSPLDYTGDLITILIPARYEVQKLLARFLTTTIV